MPGAILYLLLYIVVAGLVFWLLDWAIRYVGLPEPFNKVARVVLVVFLVFTLIYAALQLLGAAVPAPVVVR